MFAILDGLGVVAHCSRPCWVELLLCISLLQTLFKFLLALHFQFLLVLQDVKCTELVQILSRQAILAQTDKQTLVCIQDPARFEHLQAFLLDSLLFSLFNLFEKSLLTLFLELSLQEFVLTFLDLDLFCWHVGHVSQLYLLRQSQ